MLIISIPLILSPNREAFGRELVMLSGVNNREPPFLTLSLIVHARRVRKFLYLSKMRHKVVLARMNEYQHIQSPYLAGAS